LASFHRAFVWQEHKGSSKQGEFQLSDLLRQSRNNAVSLRLHLESGDAVREMISREDGLFFIATKQIIRVRSPDQLDPDLKHASAP